MSIFEKMSNGHAHRAARFATKPIGYEKPLRMQQMFGVASK
jgi:hypothetical protein